SNADWVMLSVPIPAHEEVIRDVAPLMKRDAVLFDIASVKGKIPKWLEKAREKNDIRILSTHPMFGPGATSMENKNFVLIDLEGDRKVLDEFSRIIADDHPKIIEIDYHEHDKLVAYTLGLSHFINILFGKLLVDKGVNLETLRNIEGTTFHLQHLISQEVVTQEPFIYSTIEMENEYFIDILEDLKASINNLIKIIKDKNYDEFIREFLGIRKYYSTCREFKTVIRRFNSAATASLKIIHEEDY
ncbi:MAG: prephenate dehydrogenase/arogenate dehydrogenase family protein, partial [Promethearchaeota archaeon]